MRRRIPFVPSPLPVVRRMVELAEPREGEVFYDLGCGDGRILAEASKYGCVCVGLEINPVLVEKAKKRVAGLENVRVLRADIFSSDFSDADVIATYLTKDALRILAPKFRKLKSGARIVSHDFPVPGLKPVLVERVWWKRPHFIYVYRIPESLSPPPPEKPAYRRRF